MKNKVTIIIFSALILLALVAGLLIKNRSVPVEEIELKSREIQATLSASGSVISRNDVDLSFPYIGRIYNIEVSKGDYVEKGQFIASIESYSESQSAQSLKDARDVAKSDLDFFIDEYSTNVNAVGGETEYYIKLKRQQELLNQAEAAYQAQLGSLGRRYIYAPFSGKVIDIFKEEGETVTATETVVKMADVDDLVFEIEIDQEDFGYLELGQEVEITLDAYEDEEFLGEVVELPEYVDSTGGQDFVIEIEFSGENKEKALLGMNGDAYIILQKTDGTRPALIFDEINYDIDEKPFVYILKNKIVEKLNIETGMKGDIYTEIITEISDPIIKSDNDKIELKPGMKAKITK